MRNRILLVANVADRTFHWEVRTGSMVAVAQPDAEKRFGFNLVSLSDDTFVLDDAWLYTLPEPVPPSDARCLCESLEQRKNQEAEITLWISCDRLDKERRYSSEAPMVTYIDYLDTIIDRLT